MLEFFLIVKLFTGAQDEITPAKVEVTKFPSLQECAAREAEVYKTQLPTGMKIRISTCEAPR